MAYFIFEKRDEPFVAMSISSLTSIAHIHTEIEIIYLTKGSAVCITDGREEFLNAGDLYICFPNQIHYYSAQGEIEGYLTIVASRLFSDLKDIFSKKIPINNVIKKEDLPTDIKSRTDKICYNLRQDNELLRVCANGYMQSMLAEILQKTELIKVSLESDSVKNILLYCLENYTENITLQSIAKKLYLSRYYISHIFTDRLKISFPDFINGLRVEHACRNLTVGCNITEIAFAAGFGSVRSFNRNFEQHTGLTPTAYIKQKYKR